jgi:hypothetical protein
VPLRTEEVDVQKRARVAEEVVGDEGTALIDNSERGVGDLG